MVSSVRDSLKRNISYLIVGPTLKVFEAFFDLLIPLFMKSIIDLSFNQPHDRVTSIIVSLIETFPKIHSETIINYCLVGGMFILIMGIVGFTTTMITQLLAAKCASNVGTDIRISLFNKVLDLNKKELSSISINKIQTIINSDTFQVQQGVMYFIRLATRTPFIIIGSLIFSIMLDYQIGLLFLILIPSIIFIIYFFMTKSSKQYLLIQEDLETLSSKVSDTISGIRVIKVFNKEDYEKNKFKINVDKYKKDVSIASKYNAFINPLTFALVTLIIILTLVSGSNKISENINNENNAFLPSTLITLVSYLDQIFLTVIVLTNIVIIFIRSLASSKRINYILSINPSIKNESNVKKEIKQKEEYISFNNVSFKYFDNSKEVLKDISFKLNKGESLGIIGSTGSGKSTIANLINRLIDSTSGEIKYKGMNIKEYSLNYLREETSYILQKAVLFNGSIKSNILLSNYDTDDNDINKVLGIALADEFVNKYPEKINYEVKESGKNFSGGQRQRLSIARGLIRKPELLILDDSTSALDLISDKKIRENISSNYPGLTKIIISQRISTISSCDNILVLDSGIQCGFGSHQELLRKSKVYKDIYDSQNRGEK